jgi:hypothetical protein
VNDNDVVFRRRRFGLFFDGLGRQTRGDRGVGLDDFLFKPFGGDFIEGTGRDLGGGNAHFLGLHENFFVLEAKFLRNVVNTNGHKFFRLPPTGMFA